MGQTSLQQRIFDGQDMTGDYLLQEEMYDVYWMNMCRS